ncbi:MAG: PD-(D/E)XK nuclease family protein [Armatimonadetes bacterium]|nr:PD-(D/E)XK nuclease family protein [Armatimonadota bacterium]MBS1725809.1 PD-(D/E)XK nuclease family protein [Armatimonadota bacterium]
MPRRKPTLSPSRITTYLACPMKYLWTYVDSRGKWYLKAKSYYSFGSTLHKVLERFHDSGDTGVTTVGDALKVYEESWIDAGYASPEEMQEAYGEGREIVANVIEEELKRDPGVKTVAVEKFLRADLGPFVLIGRVDRIDQHPDGTLEIVDYKSGRWTVTNEDVESDLAMACYQYLVRKNFPGVPVKATIHALRSRTTGSASLSSADLAIFENDIRVLGEQILATTIDDVAPSVKPLCEGCDFLPLCSKDPRYA